jgi:hypothetical protein
MRRWYGSCFIPCVLRQTDPLSRRTMGSIIVGCASESITCRCNGNRHASQIVPRHDRRPSVVDFLATSDAAGQEPD